MADARSISIEINKFDIMPAKDDIQGARYAMGSGLRQNDRVQKSSVNAYDIYVLCVNKWNTLFYIIESWYPEDWIRCGF